MEITFFQTSLQNSTMSGLEISKKSSCTSKPSGTLYDDHASQLGVVANEADLSSFRVPRKSRGINEDTGPDTACSVGDTLQTTSHPYSVPSQCNSSHSILAANAATDRRYIDQERENIRTHFDEFGGADGSKLLRKRSHATQHPPFLNVTNHQTPTTPYQTSTTPYKYPYFPKSTFSKKRYPEDLIEDHCTSVSTTPGATFSQNDSFGATPNTRGDHFNIPQPPSLEAWSSSYSGISFLADPLSRQLSSHWMLQPSFSRQPSTAFPSAFSRQPSIAAQTTYPHQASRVKFEYPFMPDLPDEFAPPPPPLRYRLSSRVGSQLMEQPMIASPYPVVFYPRQQHHHRHDQQQLGYHRHYADGLTPPNSQANFHPGMFSTIYTDKVSSARIHRHSLERQTEGYHHVTGTAATSENLKTILPPSRETNIPIESLVHEERKKKKKKGTSPSRATANLLEIAREKLLLISEENGNATDPQRTCTCPNSRCLKLYCVCFQAGASCSESCRCRDCQNTPGSSTRIKAIKEILSRRPDAFEVREKKTGEGCSCKKNRCLKKYCDCFAIGESCTDDKCTCIDCGNGRTRRKSFKRLKQSVPLHFVETKAEMMEQV